MTKNIDFDCIVEHLEAVKTLFKHINNAAVLDSLIRLKPLLESAKLEEHEALQVAINIDNILTDCSKRSDRDHSADSSCHSYVIQAMRNEQYRYYVLGGHANGAFEPDPFIIKREDILELETSQQWSDYCEKITYPVAYSATMDNLLLLRSKLQGFVVTVPYPDNRIFNGLISNLSSIIRDKEKTGDY